MISMPGHEHKYLNKKLINATYQNLNSMFLCIECQKSCLAATG